MKKFVQILCLLCAIFLSIYASKPALAVELTIDLTQQGFGKYLVREEYENTHDVNPDFSSLPVKIYDEDGNSIELTDPLLRNRLFASIQALDALQNFSEFSIEQNISRASTATINAGKDALVTVGEDFAGFTISKILPTPDDLVSLATIIPETKAAVVGAFADVTIGLATQSSVMNMGNGALGLQVIFYRASKQIINTGLQSGTLTYDEIKLAEYLRKYSNTLGDIAFFTYGLAIHYSEFDAEETVGDIGIASYPVVGSFLSAMINGVTGGELLADLLKLTWLNVGTLLETQDDNIFVIMESSNTFPDNFFFFEPSVEPVLEISYEFTNQSMSHQDQTTGRISGVVKASDNSAVSGIVSLNLEGNVISATVTASDFGYSFSKFFYLPEDEQTVDLTFTSNDGQQTLSSIFIPAKTIVDEGSAPSPDEPPETGTSLIFIDVIITSSDLLAGGGNASTVQIKGHVRDDSGNNPNGSVSFSIAGANYTDDLYAGSCGDSSSIDYCKGSFFVVNGIPKPYFSEQFKINVQSSGGDLTGQTTLLINGTSGTQVGNGQISINNPNSNTKWRVGTVHYIDFFASGISPDEKLRVRLHNSNGEYNSGIGTEYSDDTAQSWYIPDNLLPGVYKIRIYQDTDQSIEGWSSTFQIVDNNTAPTAKSSTIVAIAGETNVGQIVAWDDNEDQLTYSTPEQSDNGNAITMTDSSFTYVASSEFIGVDSFMVNVSDGVDSVDVTVSVTVISPENLTDFKLKDTISVGTRSESISFVRTDGEFIYVISDDYYLRKYLPSGELVAEVLFDDKANGMDVGDGYIAVVDNGWKPNLRVYNSDTLALLWELEDIAGDNATDLTIGEGKAFISFQEDEPDRIKYFTLSEKNSYGGYSSEGVGYYAHDDKDITAVDFYRMEEGSRDLVLFTGGENERVYRWREEGYGSSTGWEVGDERWSSGGDIEDIFVLGEDLYVTDDDGSVIKFGKSGINNFSEALGYGWENLNLHGISNVSSLYVQGSELYTGGYDSKINVLSADDGSLRQGIDVESQVESICYLNGVIYAGLSNGKLLMFERNFIPVASSVDIITWSNLQQSVFVDVMDLDESDVHGFDITTKPENGNATIDLKGMVTYIPAEDFYGTDLFNVTITDGEDSTIIAINVTVQNRPAQAVISRYTVGSVGTVGQLITLNGSAEDPEGDVITGYLWSVMEAPESSVIELSTTSAINTTFTPDVIGLYSISLQVSDGNSLSTITTLDISVTNFAPTPTVSDFIVPLNNTTLAFVDTGDANSLDSHTFEVVTQPLHGSVQVSTFGILNFTPDEGYIGDDSFSLKVTDIHGASSTVVISLAIENTRPVANNQRIRVQEGDSISGFLSGVDTNNNDISFRIELDVSLGEFNLVDTISGEFTYTAPVDFEGDELITFIVNDGLDDSEIATVTIDVTKSEQNQAPAISIASPIGIVTLNTVTPTDLIVSGTASDSDGAISSVYYRVNASEWSLLSGLENWQLEVTELVEGDNLFEFKAIDNVGQESATPYLTVLVTVSSDIQGTQLTLNDGDSYDFSEKITYQYSSGDFYYHSNLDNGTHSFLANNLGQRGLVDLGIIIDKTPSNIVLPLGGYQIYGVDAVEGHSYTSLAQEGEEGNVIFFTVLQLDDTSVTIDYQYLPENSFIVQEPKLIINYTVEDTTLQSCIDFIASENSFSYVHQVTDLSCIDYPNISSLAGLEHYTNLNKLQIVNGSVASLEPLSVLKSLKTLVISGGEVDDISPIVDLYNLTWLVLQQQNISDISLIDSLTKLKVLTLSNNNILDITSLGKLTKLTNLYLSDNQLGDISPLKTLTALTEFDLRFNNNITCVDVSEYFYSIDELPAECLVSSTLDSDLDGIPDFEDQFPNDSSVHLTLKTFGDGSGIIEVLDSGISCEQECTVQLITDTEYSINATLDQGTASLGWGGSDNLGCRNGSGPTYCNDVAISGYVIAQINLDIDTDFDGEGNSVDSDDDNDGLSDADELLLGTDPLSKDSDGDGYIDGVDDFPLDPNKWQHVGEENDDTSSPILTELSVSSIQVDTRLMSQNVQVTISITDDLSGFAYSGNKCSGFVDGVVFTSPSGNQNVKINNCSFELEEGSYLEGKFVATASFPQYSEEGMWQISSLIIEDQAGNMSSLSSEELENHPVTIEVISQSDTLTPVLTGLSTSLTQVITSLSEQDIKVELTITDDLSGFAYSDDKCSGFVDGVVFTSPSGNQNVKVNNCSFELVEGSDLEGKFVAIASFPQYSEEGMWQISSMIIEDQAGNKSFLSSENLTTFAVTVEVMADSDRDGIPDNTELLYGMSIDDASDAILDLDGDFLSNLEEYLLGTNPTKEDTDDDGYKDSDEASSASDPLDSESLPLDTDGDFISNVNDTDDDNDGIVDTDDEAPLNSAIGDSQAPIFSELAELSFEAVGVDTDVELITPEVTDNNLNAPTVVSNYQAALELGSHEVTWTATDFAGNVSTAVQLVHIVDTTAPEFGDLPVHTIDGRGLLTNITNDISILANDVVDGEVTATIVGDGIYASGTHKVTIAAQDTSENKVESVVEVHINPQVELSGDRKVEPGAILDIPVQLSGNAAIYPVFINYEVIGVNFVVEAAQLQIVEGVSAFLSVTIPSDAVGGQTVAVNLTSAENAVLSNAISTELTVDEENHSPTLQLSFKQNGQLISVVDAQGGIVTVTAIINDMNMLDTHEVSWNTGDSLLVDLDADNLANTFEFSPELLIAGTYGLSVEVQENNTSNLYAITVDIDLLVNTDLTLLNSDTDSDNDGISDADEGYADNDQDGIANYLDINDSSNQLPIGDGIAPMQTVNGLSLSLGDIVSSSQGLNAQSAAIEINDIIDNGGENGGSVDNAEDSYFTALSTIINFNVSGLLEVGDTAAFVIPLAEGINIPENAVYRKYKAVTGWFTFVVDEANALLSASKDSDGNCPAPLSAEYQQGLNVGDNCIQLLIEDGGPNDADGLVNAMIKDPGVLAIQTSNQAPSVTLSSHAPTFKEGVSISLSAQGLDADDDSLSYLWEQISGPSISLSNASVANVTFTAPEVSSDQTIELKVTVSDGIDSVSTTTSFVVTNVAVTTPPKESSSGGGGSMGWLLILLSFGVFRKSAFK